MQQDSRTRSPHLLPRASLLDYTLQDTWDASTPEELHTASYGVWLKELTTKPQWTACRTKTIFVSPVAKVPLADLVWEAEELPQDCFGSAIFARKLKDGKVTRRVYAHFVGNLPMRAAIWLALRYSMAPVLFVEGPGWEGSVIPAMGESSGFNMLNPTDVTKALKGLHFEASLRGSSSNKLWLQSYGFNPISQFKRLFEAKLLVREPQ
jgi:hypothetical protein